MPQGRGYKCPTCGQYTMHWVRDVKTPNGTIVYYKCSNDGTEIKESYPPDSK